MDDPIATISGDTLVCAGEEVIISSIITGGVAPFIYHWQIFQSGVWTDVSSTQPTFNTGSLTVGTYTYRLFLENANACNVVSSPLVIISAPAPTVYIYAADNPICDEDNMATLISTVVGGYGTTSYQWQYNDIALGWTNVGGNTPTYEISLPLGTYEYRVEITQVSGCMAVSNSYYMIVVPDGSVTAEVNNPAVCIEEMHF